MIMNNNFTDRRKFERFNVHKHVDLEFLDEAYDNCLIENISAGGMFVIGKFLPCRCRIYMI